MKLTHVTICPTSRAQRRSHKTQTSAKILTQHTDICADCAWKCARRNKLMTVSPRIGQIIDNQGEILLTYVARACGMRVDGNLRVQIRILLCGEQNPHADQLQQQQRTGNTILFA